LAGGDLCSVDWTYLAQLPVADAARAEIMQRLRMAVSTATTGELHRALDFLQFARTVRVGKHDLRRQGRTSARQRARSKNYYSDGYGS